MKHAPLLLVLALLAACASQPVPPRTTNPPVAASPEPASPESTPAAAAAKPEQTANGRWRLAVASERTVEEAAAWTRKLEAEGYRVETESAEVGGTTWQRVVLPGWRKFAEAKALVPMIQQQFNAPGAWILPLTPPPAAAPAPDAAEAPAAAETPDESASATAPADPAAP